MVYLFYCTDLLIRTSACELHFLSCSWSVMMVYRITVLSFIYAALISDRWLAFSSNIAQDSFPKRTDFFPPSDESTPDMRQSRKQTFFLSSSVDNSQMWPLQDKVHVPQGRERGIKNCAERKHVRRVSATSHFMICVPFFLTRKLLLWLCPTLVFRKTNSHKRSEQPCGRHMLEMGWFKLINVLWGLFV